MDPGSTSLGDAHILTDSEILGLLSLLLGLSARVRYFRSIFQGITRPHVFSWIIWGTISSIGFAAQVSDDAGAGSWARGFGAATCFLIVLVALKWGEKHITRGDWVTFAVALLAIPLWIIAKTPFWSVILVCIIDTIGYIPTIRKSWQKPRHEDPWSYIISACGAFFSILALEHYSPVTWLYPLVLSISNTLMAVYLLMRVATLTKQIA